MSGSGDRTEGGESWAHVIGGILRVAGIKGLGEAIERDQRASTETEFALAPFIQAWHERFGNAVVGSKDLFSVAEEAGCLQAVVNVQESGRQLDQFRIGESDRSRQTRFGVAMRSLVGRQHAGFRIEAAGTDRSSRQTYRLSQYG